MDTALLRARRDVLDRFVESLGAADPGGEGAAQCAFWINAHNALALAQALDPGASRTVAGRLVTPETIRDGILRGPRGDPRTLFALSDGSADGPALSPDLYRAETLDLVLTQQVRAYLADPSKARFDVARQQADLGAFLLRFRADLERPHAGEPDPLKLFLAEYAPREEIARSLRAGRWLLTFHGPGGSPGGEGSVHPLWVALYAAGALLLLLFAMPRTRPPPGPPSPPPPATGHANSEG